MPIRINFLDGGAGIEFVVTGTLTGAEILAANRQVYTRENLLRLKYKVIDRTACAKYLVTSKEIENIAEQDRAAAAINRDITIIIVAADDLQFGMTRMWQVFIEDIGFHSEIFADRAAADAYIAERFSSPAKPR
ncbi:MAG: hypothetical protein RQ753_08050 [Desulfurivibrionaceae bacterium]|nr:hypothetical protein [Desulfobulbales bacterium]MDT8335636.1 hypothetical protein [Desulfurivibrionaceae bacterium]